VNRSSAPSVAGAWHIWPLKVCARCSKGTGPVSACKRCFQNCAHSSLSGVSVHCGNTNVATSSASRYSAKRISLCFSVVQVLKLTPKRGIPLFSRPGSFGGSVRSWAQARRQEEQRTKDVFRGVPKQRHTALTLIERGVAVWDGNR
jgi:hypothetical protein